MSADWRIRVASFDSFLENILLPSKKNRNYLTYSTLQKLGARLGVRWQLLAPNYGLLWAMRSFKAKLLGQREPAKFHLVVGYKGGL